LNTTAKVIKRIINIARNTILSEAKIKLPVPYPVEFGIIDKINKLEEIITKVVKSLSRVSLVSVSDGILGML
jgi:hypothetical protein